MQRVTKLAGWMLIGLTVAAAIQSMSVELIALGLAGVVTWCVCSLQSRTSSLQSHHSLWFLAFFLLQGCHCTSYATWKEKALPFSYYETQNPLRKYQVKNVLRADEPMKCEDNKCEVEFHAEFQMSLSAGATQQILLEDQHGVKMYAKIWVNKSMTLVPFDFDFALPKHFFGHMLITSDENGYEDIKEGETTGEAKFFSKLGSTQTYAGFSADVPVKYVVQERKLSVLADKYKCGHWQAGDLYVKQVLATGLLADGYVVYDSRDPPQLVIEICLEAGETTRCVNRIVHPGDEIQFDEVEGLSIKLKNKLMMRVPPTDKILAAYQPMKTKGISLSNWKYGDAPTRGELVKNSIGEVQSNCVTLDTSCDIATFPLEDGISWDLTSATSPRKRRIVPLIMAIIAAVAAVAGAIVGGVALGAKGKKCKASVYQSDPADSLTKYNSIKDIDTWLKGYTKIKPASALVNDKGQPRGIEVGIDSYDEGIMEISMDTDKWEITIIDPEIMLGEGSLACRLYSASRVSSCILKIELKSPSRTMSISSSLETTPLLISRVNLEHGENLITIPIQTPDNLASKPAVCLMETKPTTCYVSENNEIIDNPDITIPEGHKITSEGGGDGTNDWTQFFKDIWKNIWASIIFVLSWIVDVIIIIVALILFWWTLGAIWTWALSMRKSASASTIGADPIPIDPIYKPGCDVEFTGATECMRYQCTSYRLPSGYPDAASPLQLIDVIACYPFMRSIEAECTDTSPFCGCLGRNETTASCGRKFETTNSSIIPMFPIVGFKSCNWIDMLVNSAKNSGWTVSRDDFLDHGHKEDACKGYQLHLALETKDLGEAETEECGKCTRVPRTRAQWPNVGIDLIHMRHAHWISNEVLDLQGTLHNRMATPITEGDANSWDCFNNGGTPTIKSFTGRWGHQMLPTDRPFQDYVPGPGYLWMSCARSWRCSPPLTNSPFGPDSDQKNLCLNSAWGAISRWKPIEGGPHIYTISTNLADITTNPLGEVGKNVDFVRVGMFPKGIQRAKAALVSGMKISGWGYRKKDLEETMLAKIVKSGKPSWHVDYDQYGFAALATCKNPCTLSWIDQELDVSTPNDFSLELEKGSCFWGDWNKVDLQSEGPMVWASVPLIEAHMNLGFRNDGILAVASEASSYEDINITTPDGAARLRLIWGHCRNDGTMGKLTGDPIGSEFDGFTSISYDGWNTSMIVKKIANLRPGQIQFMTDRGPTNTMLQRGRDAGRRKTAGDKQCTKDMTFVKFMDCIYNKYQTQFWITFGIMISFILIIFLLWIIRKVLKARVKSIMGKMIMVPRSMAASISQMGSDGGQQQSMSRDAKRSLEEARRRLYRNV